MFKDNQTHQPVWSVYYFIQKKLALYKFKTAVSSQRNNQIILQSSSSLDYVSTIVEIQTKRMRQKKNLS